MPHGFLILAILEKKGLLQPCLNFLSFITGDIRLPTKIKLGDVSRMRIEFDDSALPEESLRKTKKSPGRKKKKRNNEECPEEPASHPLIALELFDHLPSRQH